MDKPLVMLITHTLTGGGAERVVLDLAAGLTKHGFRTKIVTVLDKEKHGLFGLGTVADLARLMKNERPDIVHTHLFLADTWGRMAARRAGIKAVVTTEHNVNREYGLRHHLVNRWLKKTNSAFVAVSREVKKYLIQTDGVDEDKIQVIYNGVDLNKIRVRPPRRFHDPVRLITVGRLYPQKGHETLLRSLSGLRTPWRLRVIGNGPLKDKLVRLSKELKISKRVEWLGFRDEAPDLLSESDIFCFPSLWEGLGLAALEAAASGLPIVCSDLPALREVFKPTDVRFVPPKDVSAWTKALGNTLSNPDVCLTRAAQTREKIVKRFTVENMVREYADLYRKIL